MKIYGHELSGHSHRVRLMASLLGLKATFVPVDLLAGAHKEAEFLNKNPFAQVPMLEDGEISLHDSNAILVYFAQRYDPAGGWFPRDAVLAAQIQIWLSKAANELANGACAARLVTVFDMALDHEASISLAHSLLAVMEQYLASADWLVGDQPSIADVALYTYTAHAPEGGVDLQRYPQVMAWLNRIEALAGFIPMPASETEAKRALVA